MRYPTIDSLFIMIGAIIGDIIGSPYEHRNHKSTDFALFSDRSRFTDDTVLTVAVADVILHGKDYAETLVEYFSGYPNAGYGGTFIEQAMTGKLRPYNSWGNGSAMRVGPVGFAFDTAETVFSRSQTKCRGNAQPSRGNQRGSSHCIGGLHGAARRDQSVYQEPNRQAVRL